MNGSDWLRSMSCSGMNQAAADTDDDGDNDDDSFAILFPLQGLAAVKESPIVLLNTLPFLQHEQAPSRSHSSHISSFQSDYILYS